MAGNRNNWYDRKHNNPRARKHKELRRKRLSERAQRGIPDSDEPVNYEDQASTDFGKESSGEFSGIVAETQSTYCVVKYQDIDVYCEISDIPFLSEMGPLVVGDRVVFDLKDNRHGIIRQLLPRTSTLTRLREDKKRGPQIGKGEHVLAANIDVAVIVAAAAYPAFHPRQIDRYLIMCQNGNVSPMICINKIDLVDKPPDLTVYDKMGIPHIYVSATTGFGMEDLKSLMRGKVSVLTGQSGVGKSTIVNELLGEDLIEVRAVGEKTERGRHTTTVSTLHKFDDGSYIIDTPGIRSLGLFEIEKGDLRFYFPEFQDYHLRCKFNDCTHTHEPECAVKEAVHRREISEERYDSYIRLMESL